MINSDIFKKTIKNEFKFAKSSNSLSELWQRNIELPNGGCLIPLSYIHLKDNKLVLKLADWRKAASYAFPTRFQVTFEGTLRWMKSGVLDKEDRILFLIYDELNTLIGHVGFANGYHEKNLIEIDNILRGENIGRKGIMQEALNAMINWANTVLFVDGFFLRVLESNIHAVNFYKKMGYIEIEKEYLTMILEDSIEKLVPSSKEESSDAFIKMIPKIQENVGEKMILTAGPSIGFREQVYTGDAVRTGWNKNWNTYLKSFEVEFANYIGVKYAIATSSCTGALHIALAALGIGPGDEVIVPDLTWVATANAVLYVGATPIFADVSSKSWCIDPSSIEKLITTHTKAIIPVHLYGHPADMDAIIKLGKRKNLYIIEDAAPSIGAEYKGKRTGSFGHFAAFSFQGAKLAVTGEGGMLLTNDDALYKRAFSIWDQGRTPGTFWIDTLGLKYKMSNIQAAIGLAQLERNDAMVEAKRRIFGWYQNNLTNIQGIHFNLEESWAKSIYWMTSIILTEKVKVTRDDVIQQLKIRNIDSRPVFPAISQYPTWPLRQAPQTVSKYIGERGINLPSGVCLSRAEVDYICDQIISILK